MFKVITEDQVKQVREMLKDYVDPPYKLPGKVGKYSLREIAAKAGVSYYFVRCQLKGYPNKSMCFDMDNYCPITGYKLNDRK